ncbi:MAG: DinB family protein [Isosphaeraceae bacterium]
MPASQPQSDFARLTREEFARYFEHMAQRVDRMVRSAPAEWLWRKPFPFGNSIGHLVLHLTGNLNHYIGATIAGSGYVREREKEFTDPAHPPVDELLGKFHEAVAMVVRTLQSLDDQGFAVGVEHNLPIHSRLGLFLVCAAHMNNHIGQMSYLVQALPGGSNELPTW